MMMIVAVAAGSGQAEILTSLGVDVIVSGGQTMNPSTADILQAIEACNADAVIVLPNNGNIRMAAEAAASACESCKAYVVATRSVLQAFAAMWNPQMSANMPNPMQDMMSAMQSRANQMFENMNQMNQSMLAMVQTVFEQNSKMLEKFIAVTQPAAPKAEEEAVPAEEDVPVEEIPAEDVTVEEAPAEEAPAEETPAEEANE